MGILFGVSDANHGARLARIEHKLDLIMASLGIEAGDDGLDEVRRLIADGPRHKIAAIAAYRKATGAGLAEAKAAVEDLQRGT